MSTYRASKRPTVQRRVAASISNLRIDEHIVPFALERLNALFISQLRIPLLEVLDDFAFEVLVKAPVYKRSELANRPSAITTYRPHSRSVLG